MGSKEQSLEEFAGDLARAVKATFGDKVEVKAVNLYSPEAGQYPQVLDFIRQHPTATLPLIVINGKVRFDGRISPRWIIQTLQQELTA